MGPVRFIPTKSGKRLDGWVASMVEMEDPMILRLKAMTPDALFREIENSADDYEDDFDGEIIELGGTDDNDGRLLVKFSKGMGCDREDLGDVENDVRRLQGILGIRDYDMSIHFCTDREIQELNKMYRGAKIGSLILFSSFIC